MPWWNMSMYGNSPYQHIVLYICRERVVLYSVKHCNYYFCWALWISFTWMGFTFRSTGPINNLRSSLRVWVSIQKFLIIYDIATFSSINANFCPEIQTKFQLYIVSSFLYLYILYECSSYKFYIYRFCLIKYWLFNDHKLCNKNTFKWI